LRFNWIQLKTNGMQIGGECIEYLLVNTMQAKKLQKYTNMKKHIFMPLHLGMGYTNSNWKCPRYNNLRNLKLSYLSRLWWIIIIIEIIIILISRFEFSIFLNHLLNKLLDNLSKRISSFPNFFVKDLELI